MSSETHHKKTTDPNKRNKRIGLFFLITPFAGLFTILFAYAVVSFVLTNIGSATGEATTATIGSATNSSADLATTIGSIINVILGFLGVVFVVWIFIFCPYIVKSSNRRSIYFYCARIIITFRIKTPICICC